MIDKISHHMKHQFITYCFTLNYKYMYVKNELRILTSVNYSGELSKFSTVEFITVCRPHLEHTMILRFLFRSSRPTTTFIIKLLPIWTSNRAQFYDKAGKIKICLLVKSTNQSNEQNMTCPVYKKLVQSAWNTESSYIHGKRTVDSR